MGTEDEDCGKCKKKITDDDCIGCEGLCQKWFHSACAGLTTSDMKTVKKNIGLKWMCGNCNEQYVNLIDTSIKKMMNEMMINMKKTMEKMMSEKIVEIKRKAYSENVQRGNDKVTYAEKVSRSREEVLIVQPKKADQNSETTKKICKQKLNPAEMKVGIENLRKIRNGGIVIACKSKEEIAKVNDEVKKKMGNDYVVKIPNTKNPRIRIYGIEEEMDDEELVRCLKNQNSESINGESKIEVRMNKKVKNNYLVIIELDAQTFNRVMKTRRLKLKWQSCHISEHLGISRCFKCYSYDHRSDKCEGEIECLKCGGNHVARTCKSKEVMCNNCSQANESLQLNLDVRHSILSEECPVYQRRLNLKRRAITYESI